MSSLDFKNLFETYKSSVFDKDVDALMALYDKDLVAFDMWSPWSHEGEVPWHEMNKEWLGSLGSESVVVEFDEIKIVPGNETAAAYATVTYKAVSKTGEVLRSMQNRLTWVIVQRKGAWKIIHQHTSAPVDSRTMSIIFHR